MLLRLGLTRVAGNVLLSGPHGLPKEVARADSSLHCRQVDCSYQALALGRAHLSIPYKHCHTHSMPHTMANTSGLPCQQPLLQLTAITRGGPNVDAQMLKRLAFQAQLLKFLWDAELPCGHDSIAAGFKAHCSPKVALPDADVHRRWSPELMGPHNQSSHQSTSPPAMRL